MNLHPSIAQAFAIAALLIALPTSQARAQSAAAGAFELTTIRETKPLAVTAVASLRFAPEGGSIVVEVAGKPREIRADELVSLTRSSDDATAPSGALVLLPDGDRVYATPARSDANNLVLQTSWGKDPISVPLDRVLGLVFETKSQQAPAAQLVSTIRAPKREGEQIWLSNGDIQKGSFAGLEGPEIRFDPGSGVVRLESGRVKAIAFDPALVAYPKPKSPWLEVELTDGSRFGLLQATLAESRLKGAARMGSSVDIDWRRVAGLQVLGGRVAYLSDREPAGTQFVPYLDRHPQSIGRDTTWDGQPIYVAGHKHPRGLGMLPRTLAAYRIEPGDQRFRATVALDDRAGDLASVVFRVLLDRKEVFSTPPMGRGDSPVPVDIDVSGAQVLVLLVEFGERGDVQDSAVWADAQILRNNTSR